MANRRAGGERAARTAQSTYWSCHDTMRAEILNWRQRCRNWKFGNAIQFQPGQKPTGLCPVWVTNLPRHCGLGFWPGNELDRTKLPAKMRTAGGLPVPVANTRQGQRQSPNQLEANRILCEAICQKDGAAQLQCIQQVEQSLGGWVSREEALVHYAETDPFETAVRWTPALWDGGCKFFGDVGDLAALGKWR